MVGTTNTAILAGVRAGQPQAWHQFFGIYAPFLMSVGKRLGLSDADAGDVVQEALLAVYRAFRAQPEPFDHAHVHLRTWLWSVVRHKVADLRRQQAKRTQERVSDRLQHGERAVESELEAVFEAEWRRNLLSRALEVVMFETDPEVWQAFELYVLHEHSAERVARTLGTTRNAVYIAKTRVLKRLRAVWVELLQEEE